MSEATFRAVVAAVLVGALVVTTVVALVLLLPMQTTMPIPTPHSSAATTTAPSAMPSPGPAFGRVTVTPVGRVPQGRASDTSLTFQFVEPSVGAIPNSAGSFTVTLTDSSGAPTLAFTGTPSVVAPGSFGAKAELLAPNIVKVSIEGSDPLNIEPMKLTGLGISATPRAARGAINATLGSFSGSLVGAVQSIAPLTAGTVVAAP